MTREPRLPSFLMQSHPVDAHLARDQLNVASPSTSITDLLFGLLYRVIEVVQVPQLELLPLTTTIINLPKALQLRLQLWFFRLVI